MWEDDANKEGGKWIVRLRKGFATRCWENLVLAMLGEQFLVGGEICGAVVSVRYHTEDIVSIWNKNANNQGVINQIRDIMKRVLNLPNNTGSDVIFERKFAGMMSHFLLFLALFSYLAIFSCF